MVKKLKPPREVNKRSAIRVVKCGVCGWIVAAPSLRALLAAEWRVGCEGETYAFMCPTCIEDDIRASKAVVETVPHLESVFRSLPEAPEHPFPCIGVAGHQTTRQRDEEESVHREDA